MSEPYPRDLVGYGEIRRTRSWPDGARLALSFVLNYEEGGEASVLHGDPASEVYLHEVPGGAPLQGERNLSVESVYEYGARAGFWRMLRLFRERGLTLTVYAVGMALERNPAAGRAMVEAGFEIASHGWRWIDYHHVPEAEERDHIRLAIAAIERATGAARSAGTPGATARTRAAWWSRKGASSTIPTPTPTTAVLARSAGGRIWSSPTRSTTTT